MWNDDNDGDNNAPTTSGEGALDKGRIKGRRGGQEQMTWWTRDDNTTTTTGMWTTQGAGGRLEQTDEATTDGGQQPPPPPTDGSEQRGKKGAGGGGSGGGTKHDAAGDEGQPLADHTADGGDAMWAHQRGRGLRDVAFCCLLVVPVASKSTWSEMVVYFYGVVCQKNLMPSSPVGCGLRCGIDLKARLGRVFCK